MRKPGKIAFESCLWLGLVLMACFLGGGCQSAKPNDTFSPLPADLSEDTSGFAGPSSGSYRRITITNTPEARIYYVGGQVRQPGRQVYLGATTVSKAIQCAGDFTDFADGTRVKLVRASGEVLEVNCLKLHSPDPPVYPGDKINVPQRSWWDWFPW